MPSLRRIFTLEICYLGRLAIISGAARAEPCHLQNTRVSTNCVWCCRQSPGIRPDALEEAPNALAAGKPYGIYKVMLTAKNLRRLGLSA